jgi:hypothetical protein
MARRLDPEDKRKIHAEINQLVHQRFLLATAAVTVFGVVSAWSIPRDLPQMASPIGAFTCAVSILLTLVLFALFILSHLLANVLRTYASYLRVTGESQWEQDWKDFRSAGYSAYTKAITALFLVLGIITSAFPFALGFIYTLAFEPNAGLWLTAVIGGLYVVFVTGMGFLRWFDKEAETDQRWRGVLARRDSGAQASKDGNGGSAA